MAVGGTTTVAGALMYLAVGSPALAETARNDDPIRLHMRRAWQITGGGQSLWHALSETFKLLTVWVQSDALGFRTESGEAVGSKSITAIIEDYRLCRKVNELPVLIDFARLEQLAKPPENRATLPLEPSLAELRARQWLNLNEALRVTASYFGPGGSEAADVLTSAFWAGAKPILERFEKIDGRTAEFSVRATKVREKVRVAMLECLARGTISAISASGPIPADRWIYLKPDWWRATLDRISTGETFREILIPQRNLAKVSPESFDTLTETTGMTGRPSAKNLILSEFRRRVAAEEFDRVLAKEAAVLAGWYEQIRGEGDPGATLKTIENQIRGEHRNAKATKL